MITTHKILDIIRLGLHSLTVHKVRSLLTSLGIVIGVWSVIVMLAINEGFSYEAQRSLRELGSDNIIINSVKPPDEESKASGSGRGVLNYGLKYRDVSALQSNLPGVKSFVSVHRTLKYARVQDKSITVSVIGTEPTYQQVARIDLVSGRFISSADLLQNKPYCVITHSLARRLFAYREPIGETILISAEPFVVVGIISRLPAALAGGGSDTGSHIIVPLTTERNRFGEYNIMRTQGGRTQERVEVSQVILQMNDEKSVVDGAAVARVLLEKTHDQSDYEVIVPLELLAQIEKQRRLWNFMFVMIASISLLVGGIGIMNIMLASVTERTREIGVRRALGAQRADIITQFLVESVALTSVGGLMGIVLGLPIPYLVSGLMNMVTIITPMMLFLPFTMAVLVGLASGLYPSMRAAKLDPITALRHE